MCKIQKEIVYLSYILYADITVLNLKIKTHKFLKTTCVALFQKIKLVTEKNLMIHKK